ncbi:RYamide receptor-like [Paramacrobiotus metropolitanus]|uniref:RYamide receptor-like n=1 Tax=Paramacrobiotus metropolitanus TaxID=2943436 RepID=UPI0024459E89|nr:RYamide receptor-like [Paramacrobiotus metropolitanus]
MNFELDHDVYSTGAGKTALDNELQLLQPPAGDADADPDQLDLQAFLRSMLANQAPNVNANEPLFDFEQFLEQYKHFQNLTTENQPPLEMSPAEQTFLNILYGAAIAVALTGNLSVILVFLFGRRWKSDLSIFLVNLAFSDIVLAVFCMPFTMSQVVKHHWQFPDPLCPIVLFLQLSSVLTSVYTLVAIGVDRYLFVTRPLKARLTKRKGKFVVVSIWIFALLLSSVQLAVVRCMKFIHNGQVYKDCQEAWPSEEYRKMYTVTVALLTYVIPLSLLIYTYIRVGSILWLRTPPGESVSFCSISSMSRTEERRTKSKQRVVKMLVVIVLVFAICWFPLHLFFVMIDFFPELIKSWRDRHELSFTYTFLAIHFLAMSSSYVNPLIYSFMNQNFRSDVRQLWHRSISAVKRCCRKMRQDDYESEEEDSFKPFQGSPLSLLKRSSSTPPAQIAGLPPDLFVGYLSNITPALNDGRSECSYSDYQSHSLTTERPVAGTRRKSHSKTTRRSKSISGRASKEDTYG